MTTVTSRLQAARRRVRRRRRRRRCRRWCSASRRRGASRGPVTSACPSCRAPATGSGGARRCRTRSTTRRSTHSCTMTWYVGHRTRWALWAAGPMGYGPNGLWAYSDLKSLLAPGLDRILLGLFMNTKAIICPGAALPTTVIMFLSELKWKQNAHNSGPWDL